jgi:hypothetical protein
MSDPCECPEEVPVASYCNLDRTNNVWVEGVVDENGEGGICLLDTMTESQIIYSLQRDETARADLLRVTSDPHLVELANTIPRLPTVEEGDKLQTSMNRNAQSLPFYTLFKGNIQNM